MVGSSFLTEVRTHKVFTVNTVCVNVSKWFSPKLKQRFGLDYAYPLLSVAGNQRFERVNPIIHVDTGPAFRMFDINRKHNVEELQVNCMCVMCGTSLYRDFFNECGTYDHYNMQPTKDCVAIKTQDAKYFVFCCRGQCQQVYNIAFYSREDVINDCIANNYLFKL